MTIAKAPKKIEADDDSIIGQIQELYEEARSDKASFDTRLAKIASTLDPVVSGGLEEDLFSIVADLAGLTLQAHADTFAWAEGVDDDLAELKEGNEETQFLPEDAHRLKSLLLALQLHLAPPADASDTVPDALKKQVAEAILFIDENTLEDEEEEEKEAPGEADGDDEDDEEEGDEE